MYAPLIIVNKSESGMLPNMITKREKIAVVIPMYNEENNIRILHQAIEGVFAKMSSYDPIFYFVDDGSSDKSLSIARELAASLKNVNVVALSRNFGKEAALSAGLREAADAAAVVLIDADMQHPPEYIPIFLEAWEEGADVVVGIRGENPDESMFRRTCSRLFATIMSFLSQVPTARGATDFRILDRQVVVAFNSLSERNRVTRTLIDWLGFPRVYVPFTAAPRYSGTAQYSFVKLVRLAFDAFVSHSLLPLRFAGYLGVPITLFSGGLGLFILVEQLILGDPLNFQVPGTAMLAVMILFLNGIVLLSLGLVSMYIAHIHDEATGRPLYVIRHDRSVKK